MKRIKHTAVVAMVVATALAVRAAPQDEGALSRVKENFIRVLCASDARLSAEIAAAGDMHDIGDFTVRAVRDVLPPDGDRIEALLHNQREDGSWADVDYDSATRSVWPAAVHLENMKALARAPRTERTIEAFHRALGFWLGRNFRNPNWWWNEIGAPLSLGSSALMMDGELSAEERTGVVSVMRECKIGMTGQNRVWLAECVLMRALLEGSEHDLAAARNAISDEIAISRTEEGIQEDWSFHQHGNMAQFGNYGASYILTVSRLAAVFAGTGSDLPEEKMAILENLVDKGFRPVVWRGAMDVGSLGRQLSPNAMRKKGLSPLVAAWWLSKTGREEAKRIFRDCLVDMHGERAEVQRTGLCWFPKSATGTYRADGWMAAVKCETASIKGTERINEDNILGAHLADGALFTSVTGDEYRDVFPLWNWRHVPGTTSYDIKDVDWEDRNLADKCEVRGCEVEFVLDRAGLKARTRWRFSDAGVDVDVSGIASTNAHPVVTTVEQSIARPNASWCYEDGGIVAVNGFIRYELPSNAVVRIEERTGSWRDNMGALPCEPVKGRVFEIVIPHGIRPDGVGCSWRVRPLAANMRSPFKDGDRVVFFGDSITHGGFYGEYVNLFYATRYPERNIWFSNSGWSGASAEQGLWSIEDDVVAKKPTVVTVMFGMNDINRNAWPRTNDTLVRAAVREGAIRTYDTRMDELVRRVRAEAGNPEIIYFTPSPYDQTCLVDGKPSDIVCNDGLAILADHVRSWAARDGATCVDLQKTMLAINATVQEKDPSASIIVNYDRVHPGPLGHTVMLYEILKAQGAESCVDEIERDANGADALAFTCTEKSLPFPMTAEMRGALGLVPFEKDFNREILRVRNLKEGRYAVKIDGTKVGVWTAAELSEGVNLALNEKTPQYRQAAAAAEICRRLWTGERMLRDLVTRRRWMRMHYKIDPDAPGAAEGILEKLLAEGKSEDSYEVKAYRAYLKNWPRHAAFEAAVVKDRAALAGAVRPKTHRFEIAFARPAPRPALAARLAEGPEIYGIVHWGLNTYTDREWGFGDEDPAMLDPGKFDADQIVGACKAGGLGGLIVVAKHHDGFCLWPTKTTDHNIRRSPFWTSGKEEGKGKGDEGRDYVKEMSEACRRAGLKFGVYVSPWDRNNAAYGTEKYVTDVFQKQIRELVSGDYGEIFEMWFDGANGGDGWYGGANEKRKIPSGYYRYGTETFAMVRRLQPKVCIFNEMDEADSRFGGNALGLVDPDSRSTGGHYDGIWDNYKVWANTGIVGGSTFHPIEADFPLRRGWFYHESERGTTKSAAYLMKLYLSSVGNAATMNIGIAPNRDGRLDADDVKALKGFGDLLKIFFSREAKDGGPFNVVVLREDVSRGELVDDWELAVDGKAILSGKSIGVKRIRTLDSPVAGKVELKVSSTSGEKPGKVSVARYFVDPELLKTVQSATTESGETDTARWMTAAASKGLPSVGTSSAWERAEARAREKTWGQTP